MPPQDLSSFQIFRRLVAVQPSTHEAIWEEVVRLNFAPIAMKVPVRHDAMKLVRQDILKRDQMTVQLMFSIGRIGNLTVHSLSLSIMDKAAELRAVNEQLSAWLSCDADTSFPKNAKFRLRYREGQLFEMSSEEEAEWHKYPEGALVYIIASDMGFGVSMNMMMHTSAPFD